MSWANFIAGLAHQYPDAAALIIASLLSWAPAVVLEYFFLPETGPIGNEAGVADHHDRGSVHPGRPVWHKMDPEDTKGSSAWFSSRGPSPRRSCTFWWPPC